MVKQWFIKPTVALFGLWWSWSKADDTSNDYGSDPVVTSDSTVK